MTTIIKYETSGGKRRYCNGVCHKAKGPVCRCICSGAYHGSARDGTLSARMSQFQNDLLQKLSEEGEILQAQLTLI